MSVFQKYPFQQEALFDTQWGSAGADPLEKEVASLLAQSRFLEAEALVRRNLSPDRPDCLRSALYLYNALNQMPDERLNAHGFPRQRIREALDELTQIYQIAVPDWDNLMK